MARSYVSSVKSNLKGGCEVALTEKVLIVGRNGRGKSTITQAVELALTGSVSDVAGRAALAKDGDLVALLAPPDAPSLFAEIGLSTGGGGKWEGIVGKRATHAIFSGVNKETVLPLRAVREALLGSPETGRKWLLGLAGTDANGITAKLEAARTRARNEGARAKALRESAAQQAAGLPPEGSAQPVVDRGAPLRGSLENARRVLAGAEEALATFEARVKLADEALAAAGPPPASSGLAEVGGAILTVLSGQITAGASKCGVCGGDSPLEAANVRHQRISDKIAQAVEAERVYQRLVHAAKEARFDHGTAVAEINRLSQEVARWEAAVKSLAAGPAPEQSALAARWEGVRALEQQAQEAEVAAASAAAVAKTLTGDLSRAVEQARADFEAQVQKYLPAGDTFGIDLFDGEREVFRVGLRRAGKLHAALSGAEWARVVAAVAAACLPAGEAPAVVIPEERAFDPETLDGVLLAFDAIPAQVIVTSPVAPANGVPAGWSVIEVGEPLPEFAPQPRFPLEQGALKPATDPASLFDSEPAAGEKKARKPRKDKGTKRGEPAAPANVEPAADTSAGNGSRPPHEGKPGWCAECESLVVIGSCEHGVQAPAKPVKTAIDDLFD